MATTSSHPVRQPGFVERLTALLAGVDHGIAWWGAHRAWPANEPARIETRRD